MNYLIAVNKQNPLLPDWEKQIRTIHFTNCVGDDVEVEEKAYKAYLKLKEKLEDEGIFVDLDSALRSISAQQKIVDDFTQKYGNDYTAKTVARPGYSEHHTGLALDLILIVDGKIIYENEDLVMFTEIWQRIHELITDYGFILRYPKGKEHITGYAYEPWHIRYLDDVDIARRIVTEGVTLEEYLGLVKDSDPKIDYGDSKLYTKQQIYEAIVRVKCQLAFWKGVELQSIRYAGDGCLNEENLKWLNSISKGKKYSGIIELLCDFHTSAEDCGTLEADHEYKDHQWWLACEEDGDFDIVTFGY